MGATGLVVLLNGDDDLPTSTVQSAHLAGSLFPGDPAAQTDGGHQALNGIAASGSTVVAVGSDRGWDGERGQFLVSADGGRSFELASVRTTTKGEEPPYQETPQHVAHSRKGWLALGRRPAGVIAWTSGDGRTWTRERIAATAAFGRKDKVHQLIGFDSGFLAVGEGYELDSSPESSPTLWASADGRRWERRIGAQLQLPANGGRVTLVNVAAVGSTVIVQGVRTNRTGKPEPRNLAWRSDDGGRSWTSARIPAPKGTVGLTISQTSNGFIAAREIAGRQAHSLIFHSPDGAGWQKKGELRMADHRKLERLSGSDEGLTAIVAAGKETLIAQSVDGSSWQTVGKVPASSHQTLTGSVFTGGQIVAAGYDNGGADTDALLLTSAQGQLSTVDLTRVAGAVQRDKTVRSMAAVGNRAVAVGSSDGDAAIWTSGDGNTWTRAQGDGKVFARTGRQQLIGVTTGSAGWLAIGLDDSTPTRPVVMASVDGRTWQAADSADIFQPRGGNKLVPYATAAGSAGHVVVGEDGATAAVWHSSDLRTWQRGTGSGADDLGDGKSSRWMRDVIAGPFGYVAVGGMIDPTAQNTRRPAVWTSADGRQWVSRRVPAIGDDESSLLSLTAKGNALVAVGTARSAQGERPIGYLSTDGGANWQPVTLPVEGQSEGTNLQVTRVVATPKGYLAVGTTGRVGSSDVVLWTSADGRAWTLHRTKGTGLSGAGDQEITGLVMYQGQLLGVGRISDHKGTQPTLWRSQVP